MKSKKYIAPFQKIEAGKNDTEAKVKETGGSSSCLFVKLDNARDLPVKLLLF